MFVYKNMTMKLNKKLIPVSQKYQKGWNPYYKGGLQRFWIRYDIDHTRYLPIDFMYEHLGANFCSNLLNGDISAGYGMQSKIVSKKYNKGIATPIREVSYFF